MDFLSNKIYQKMLLIAVMTGLVLPLRVVYGQDVKEVEERLMRRAEENIEKYRKGDAEIRFKTQDGTALSGARVEIIQQSHDFLFGCIIFPLIWEENVYRPDLYKSRFRKIFNMAIFPFYWPAYESLQGQEEWQSLMPTLEWCHANGITPKGHPLVWSCETGMPDWLKNYTPDQISALSRARVMNITGGYRDLIGIWDVVNEPVNLKTWENKISDLDDVDDWGHEEPIPGVADYVEDALLWAQAGNPGSTLMINEYRTIADETVRERYDKLITELLNRDAPLKGIGIQAHEPRQEWFPPQEVWKTFELYSRHGLPIHITELHPQSSGVDITGGWREGQWTPEAQTEFTRQFLTLCFGHPSVASVNWWGFSDRNIWLPGGGLLDEDYSPKPVYEMLDKLINEEWHTDMKGGLNNKGSLSFRGFFGDYHIKLTTPDGKTHTYNVSLRKDEANEWEFTVD